MWRGPRVASGPRCGRGLSPCRSATKLGDVATGILPVTWASNGVGGQQIMFTSGGRGYIFDLRDDTFTPPITAEHFPQNVIACAYIQTYFLVLPANSRQFHYSRQFNGLEWDAFDVAQKANTPDVLRGLVVHDDVVRLIGSRTTEWSGRPGSLLTLAPHRSGRAGSAASGSSTDGFATRRRVPAGPGSQAMATAIPKACLASSAIRCRDVETGPNLGVLAVFPSTGAPCRGPLPSTGSRGLNSPASAVL